MHYWDGANVTSKALFAANKEFTATYDYYLLLGPDATWKDGPGPVLGYGRPVISSRDDLSKQLQPFLRA